MSHIHTQPGQHDFTASAFIVRTDTPEPAIMLHLHKKLGIWLQFGGHVELHENPWQAVTHEILEESGYALSQLRLLQPNIVQPVLTDAISHPFPANSNTHKFGDSQIDHSHTDIGYAFVTDQSPSASVGSDESKDIRTFTAKQLAALGKNEIPANVREVAMIILGNYINSWKQVPLTDSL